MMRIIAGTARSLPLKTVEGMDTRPTTDRIKETLFNIIQWDLPDAYFLDLFAGSGGIGLEALSRGAKKVVFVDNAKKAISCIKDNIAFTGFGDRSVVMATDFKVALMSMGGKYVFDVIFMDPPYGKGFSGEALRILADSDICDGDTTVIVEEKIDFLPEDLLVGGFVIDRIKKYKTNQHIFLRKDTGHRG